MGFRSLGLLRNLSKRKNIQNSFVIRDSNSPSFDFEKIKIKLSKKRDKTISKFEETQKRAGVWFKKNDIDLAKIRETSQKALTGTLVAGGLLLSSGTANFDRLLPKPKERFLLLASRDIFKDIESILLSRISNLLPETLRSLNDKEEAGLEKAVYEILGIKAKFELDGNRLNVNYGIIGGEQHLQRYPGDYIGFHDEFTESGMAPNLGAFGYFANSASEFSSKDSIKEKYYIATQTFLIPDWERRWLVLRDWLKFRKVLVINPNTGQSVVAVIGDSGPATWTGKQFGGSPEIMHIIGYGEGSRRGEVIIMFIDDPEDKIPLGPIQRIEHTSFKV